MLVGLLGPVLPGYKSYHLSGDDIPPNPLGLLSFTQTATYHTLHLPGSRLLLHFWYYRAVGSDMLWPPFKNNKCKVSYDFRDGGNATFTKL